MFKSFPIFPHLEELYLCDNYVVVNIDHTCWCARHARILPAALRCTEAALVRPRPRTGPRPSTRSTPTSMTSSSGLVLEQEYSELSTYYSINVNFQDKSGEATAVIFRVFFFNFETVCTRYICFSLFAIKTVRPSFLPHIVRCNDGLSESVASLKMCHVR